MKMGSEYRERKSWLILICYPRRERRKPQNFYNKNTTSVVTIWT